IGSSVLAISLVFKRQGNCYLIFQSGTKRNVISPVPYKGGTKRTDITGTKRTEMDCVDSQKWHRSNRNAWHYNTEMGGTKRTEVSRGRTLGRNPPLTPAQKAGQAPPKRGMEGGF
ncbi:hypothetical protein, partial [Arenibacter sp. F20364]|uniref:hypothetical protein n=1 Tax=Arenibacter sp. F20364 TaxID=2926415 RepID=UPI001FF138C5